MVQKKCRALYSAKSPGKPGPKGPDQELIRLVLDIKHRNPRMGYDRIAMQVLQAFGVEVDKHVIRRILAKHYKPIYPGGPSWLTFLGQAKDSLWGRDAGPIDLFRCESIGTVFRHLRSHWVMLAVDIHTRRIVGFAAHAGDVNGSIACRLLNQILGGRSPPARISTDHDPIFKHHRWQATLRVLDIDEVKTVPYTPQSQDYVSYCTSLAL